MLLKPFKIKSFVVPEDFREPYSTHFSPSQDDYIRLADPLHLTKGYMSLSICLDLRAYTILVLLVRMAQVLLSLSSVGSSHLCSPFVEVSIE